MILGRWWLVKGYIPKMSSSVGSVDYSYYSNLRYKTLQEWNMMNLALLQNFDPGRNFQVGARIGGFFQIFLEKNMNKHSLFVNPPLKWGLDDGFVSWKVEFWGFEGWYIMDF